MVTIAVLATGALAVAPIRDAATGGDVTEAYLTRPLTYVAIAPVSGVLDTLTLLSARQHIALFVGVLVIFAGWRAWQARRGSSPAKHAIAVAALLGAIVVTYAAAAIMPRPMAALASDNGNILRIDFHSHTTASHDGHQGVEELREWHRKAGFDIAYVTDHGSVAAAERGLLNNPRPAGTGVTLLQSIEVTWAGEHVSVPGAERAYKGLFTTNLTDVDTQALSLSSILGGNEPIVIWNHPRDLARLKLASEQVAAGIRAIEVVNGAPKDIDTGRRLRRQILELAQTGDVALTAGTDNHGFGRVAPGWTLMIIFAWRGLEADALAAEINKALREGKFAATKVVERRVADPGESAARLALSVVTVPYRMLTTLSIDERVSWLVWTWLAFGILVVIRRRNETWPASSVRSRS